MMIVVSILLILAAIEIPNLMRARMEALSAEAQDFFRFQFWQDAESREEMKGLEEILALDAG